MVEHLCDMARGFKLRCEGPREHLFAPPLPRGTCGKASGAGRTDEIARKSCRKDAV